MASGVSTTYNQRNSNRLLEAPAKITIASVAKFIASNICFFTVPVKIAHCAPHFTYANMKYAFIWLCVLIQSDITLSTIGWSIDSGYNSGKNYAT